MAKEMCKIHTRIRGVEEGGFTRGQGGVTRGRGESRGVEGGSRGVERGFTRGRGGVTKVEEGSFVLFPHLRT